MSAPSGLRLIEEGRLWGRVGSCYHVVEAWQEARLAAVLRVHLIDDLNPNRPVPSWSNSMNPGATRSMASVSHNSIDAIRYRPAKSAMPVIRIPPRPCGVAGTPAAGRSAG